MLSGGWLARLVYRVWLIGWALAALLLLAGYAGAGSGIGK